MLNSKRYHNYYRNVSLQRGHQSRFGSEDKKEAAKIGPVVRALGLHGAASRFKSTF